MIFEPYFYSALYPLSIFFQFSLQEKEQFVDETMNLEVSARIKIQLAMSIPIGVEGSAAFMMNDDSTSQTQSMILSLSKTSQIQEIPKESYLGRQDMLNLNATRINRRKTFLQFHQKYSTNSKAFFLENPVLRSALKNSDQVTHVVTYIEYGSSLNIELTYEGK